MHAQVSNVTDAATDQLNNLNITAYALAPTYRDLGQSFNASIALVAGPTAATTISGAGTIVADLATLNSVASNAAGFAQQLGSLVG